MSYATRNHSAVRTLVADAALVITDADAKGFGTIRVSTAAGTKAATFSWLAPADSLGGAKFQIQCYTASGGAYTVACTYGVTVGNVTIDALHESPVFHRVGTTLICLALGGATFA